MGELRSATADATPVNPNANSEGHTVTTCLNDASAEGIR